MFRFFFLISLMTSPCFSKSYAAEEPYPYCFEGVFEEYRNDRLNLISKFLPSNPIILEAGAHYGLDTVNFYKLWPLSRVLAFEPNPSAFEKLAKQTAGLENVSLYNFGLSDNPGTALFYVCYGTEGNNPEFEGASSLLPPSESMEIHYGGPRIEITCVLLDDWCKQNGVDHIDFMWLDMEGMELQVLKSSPEILDTVKVIYTETNMYPFRIGTTGYQELRSFLESSGFKLLSHWYLKGLQGDAIFIRSEIYNALFNEVN